MFIRFLRTLFGIYAALVFTITMLIVVIAFFLIFTFAPKKKAPFWAHRYVSYNWAKTLFIFFLVRWKIKNADLVDPKGNYVFVANHRSMLDIPAYALAGKNTFRFLSKAELAKIPVLGFIIRNLYITVDRKNKNDRARSMEAMMQSLRDGVSIFICPEGTRNTTKEPLLDFRDGAFRIAIEAQVPVAVLTVKNADKLLSPLRPIELRPGTVELIWSKPIPTKGMTMDDIPRLKEMARAQMIQNLI
ncbi:MAG TPA: lysophospholipid acyltransferase family protein [Chitinophagaceae bacterium]|nr:lysophospholipid acyltransferase family protein [Chitinophagaceae bacterium]